MCVGSVDTTFTYAQSQLKGEDVMLVPSGGSTTTSNIGNCLIFSICDGHASNKASVFAGKNLERIIAQNIDQDQLEHAHSRGIEEVARVFRLCLQKSFAQLDMEFMRKYDCIAGSTVSVVVVYGRLVSIANIGDSRAILVTPNGAVQELTVDHRIHDNKQERERMIANGANIARSPLAQKIGGILRIWPGGLALSRSMGDEISKPYVVSDPYISQVILPQNTKAKIIMASDGLWDDLSTKQATQITLNTKLSALPQRLIRKSIKANGGSLLDDTSVIAISLKAGSEKNIIKEKVSNLKQAFCNFFCAQKINNQETHVKHSKHVNNNKNKKGSSNNNNQETHVKHIKHVGTKNNNNKKGNNKLSQNTCFNKKLSLYCANNPNIQKVYEINQNKNKNKMDANDKLNLPKGFSMISQDMRIPILRMDTLSSNLYKPKHVNIMNIFNFDVDFDSDSDSNSNQNFNQEFGLAPSLSSELSEDFCKGYECFRICPAKLIRKDVSHYYYYYYY